MTGQLLNPTHIVFLLVVVLLILGPKKLPDTGRALGRSMREFRDGVTGREHAPAETQEAYTPPPVVAAPPPAALASAAPPEQPAAQSAAVTVRQPSAPASPDERTAV